MASIDLIEGCTYREFSSLKADLIPYILEKQNAKDSYGMFFSHVYQFIECFKPY